MESTLELSRSANQHIENAEQVLLEGGPNLAERCEAHLGAAVQALRQLAATPRASLGTELIASLRRVRQAGRRLRAQAYHAMKLYDGWIQFSAGRGYRPDGSPLPPTPAPRIDWEA